MYSKLKSLQENSDASVRLAFQFLADLHGRRMQSDEMMVSFDMKLLLTYIPPYLTRDVLRRKLDELYDETQSSLKSEHRMRLFEFCQNTYFIFAGEIFQQIKETPIGSAISGLIAELVLKDLEKIAFSQRPLVFWCRYVFDTFVTIKRNMLHDFHELLNSIFPDI